MRNTVFFSILFLLIISCSNSDVSSENESSKDTLAIIDNLANGEHVEHYPNGNIKISGMLVGDKRVGIWRAFYENGNRQSETEYINGQRNGKSTVWYSDGKIRYQGYYKADNKVGNWIFFDENGETAKEEIYREEN